MIKNLCHILILILAQLSFGQTSIEYQCIDCEKENRTETVQLAGKINNPIAIKTTKDKLHKFKAEGFLAATIDTFYKTVDSSYIVVINRGSIFTSTMIQSGNLENETIQKLGYRNGILKNKPFTNAQLLKLTEKILRFYEDRGYPFVSVSFKDLVRTHEDALSATLHVEKNTLIRIDSVHIKGDANISKQFMLNYLGLKEDDIYRESTLRNVASRIKELPFVAEIKPLEIEFTDNKAEVYIYLKKRNASNFSGILGVLPDNTGKIVVTGDVKLHLRSTFGYGEEVKLNWKRLQTSTQDLEGRVIWPFLFKSPFGLDYQINLYRKDSSFINVNNEIGTTVLLKGANYIKGFYGVTSSNRLSTTDLEFNSNPSFLSTRVNSYGIEFNYEKLDYRLNPRRGFQLYAKASVGNKKVLDTDSIAIEIAAKNNINNSPQYKAELNSSVFIPVYKRFCVHVQNQTGVVENQSLFRNELFRIGGLNTLRGFNEQSIFASFYSINTIEFRMILEQNSYLYLFGQGGYYENKSYSLFLVQHYVPSSFGAGISFETAAGIFTINYALGNETNGKFLLRTGKVHFGFVNFF